MGQRGRPQALSPGFFLFSSLLSPFVPTCGWTDPWPISARPGCRGGRCSPFPAGLTERRPRNCRAVLLARSRTPVDLLQRQSRTRQVWSWPEMAFLKVPRIRPVPSVCGLAHILRSRRLRPVVSLLEFTLEEANFSLFALDDWKIARTLCLARDHGISVSVTCSRDLLSRLNRLQEFHFNPRER